MVEPRPPFGSADLLLMFVVTGQALGIAYLHSPRAKSLLYMLPLPFSAAVVAAGQGIDVTHLFGISGTWAFLWVVWFLYRRMGIHIIVADLIALAVHGVLSFTIARLVPASASVITVWYWIAAATIVLLGSAAVLAPHPHEPGHRSPMPVWVKTPLTLLLVALLILAKKPLRGFMPTFPMVTLFAVYESRHSLRTLAQRMPIFILGFVPMVTVVALLLPDKHPLSVVDYLPALAAGWAVFVPIYLALDAVVLRRSRKERLWQSHTAH